MKRFKRVESASALIWKLLMVAEKSSRALKGYWLLRDDYVGDRFVDGKKAVNREQSLNEEDSRLKGFYTPIDEIRRFREAG